MKFFIDTANLKEIEEGLALGLVDGVTTNPSLFAKEGRKFEDLAPEICAAVGDRPVSLEVTATEAGSMVEEARSLIKIAGNVVIKLPLTIDGLKACRILSQEGIKVNQTLVFSPIQALLAAKAGASYVSPFVGRLDDITVSGMEIVEQVLAIYANYGFETEVLVASVRSPMHVLEAALMGADVATIPFKVLSKLAGHPLTEIGLDKFLADWEKSKQT
ncbi:MAG: fructose-6-phosphate aldolase [Deltaproteobacteria bacterium]|nr:fructose-6-phosphate aldolase [Deltaproteobacteria bacterium]